MNSQKAENSPDIPQSRNMSNLSKYYWFIRRMHEWVWAVMGIIFAPLWILDGADAMESYLSWLFWLFRVDQYVQEKFPFTFAIIVVWIGTYYVWGNPLRRWEKQLMEPLTFGKVIRAYVAFFWAIVFSIAIFFYQEYALWIGLLMPLSGVIIFIYLWIRTYIFGNDRVPDALGRPIW